MAFLFGMMMIYYSFSSMEEYFADDQPGFGTLILFNALMSLIYGYLANDYMVMLNPFLFSMIYTWSKLVPD